MSRARRNTYPSGEEGPPLLPPDYYLQHFKTLLEFVSRHYGDLLNQDDRYFLACFNKLPDNAQKLYVRLINRSAPAYRLSKLHYPEISALQEAIGMLEEGRFLSSPDDIPLADRLSLFTRTELLRMTAALTGVPASINQMQKKDIVSFILNNYNDSFDTILKSSDILLVPAYQDTVALFMVLFFGNTRQGLSDFILEDIGVLKYEKYPITGRNGFFSARAVAVQYLEVSKMKQAFHQAGDAGEPELTANLIRYILEVSYYPQVKERMLSFVTEAGRFFERRGNMDLAIRCYTFSLLPPARERLTRYFIKRQEWEEAFVHLTSMIKRPLSPGEEFFATRYYPIVSKKLGKSSPFPLPRRQHFPEMPLEGGSGNSEVSIEITALKLLTDIGYKGFYSENSLWQALFGLVFWEVIFSPVPGQFFHPFQRGPADLFTPFFRKQREEQVHKVLAGLPGQKDLTRTLLTTYQEKEGTANHLVNWKKIMPEQIVQVTENVPAIHLARILDRMSHHLKLYSSGFPDLFLYSRGGYTLAEVKGPGDQLRPNQRGWLQYFEKTGIPFRVIRMVPPGT